MELVQFCYWASVTVVFIATWLSFMVSLFSTNKEERESNRRFYMACIFTLIMLGLVGWAIHTQLGVRLVPIGQIKKEQP